MLPLKDASLLRQQAFIDGRWQEAGDGARFEVTNPASGAPIARVPACGPGETQAAIDAAAAALGEWRARPAGERAALLQRLHALMLEHQDDLAVIMTSEQGKPLAEARGEIAYAAGFIDWFAGEARRIYGEVIPGHQRDRRIVVLRQPIGVVACITPWNFPTAMLARKVGPALAAGCTVVCKPASQTPLSALALAELAARAGLPRGVLNLVTGPPEPIGRTLTVSPVVRKLSFTGSTEVGRQLLADCAATVKKVSLELGGNAPFIVFDDADLDAAVEGALASKFRNSGQTCVCANRLLVQAGIHDAFAERLATAVSQLHVGDGLTPGTEQGPLIDERALARVEAHIADALALGATLRTGGRRHARGGTFHEPTVLVGVDARMRIAREETFGPVAALFRFDDEAQAIRMANDTEYGLAAYLWTRDLGRSWRVAEALEYGMVGLNTGLISTEVAPFGGIKQSGIGREGSRHGIEEYLEMKYLCMAGIDA